MTDTGLANYEKDHTPVGTQQVDGGTMMKHIAPALHRLAEPWELYGGPLAGKE